MSEDDFSVFRDAMNGVKPLKGRSTPPERPKPAPKAHFSRRERQEVLHESLHSPFDPADLETGDELVFLRPGVREDLLRRLRRGQFAIESEIDLHGLTRHSAHEALRQFIAESVARGLGCVRVIHGKGRGSGPRGPVLKYIVNRWLRRMNDVAAFATARPVDGGTGAVYVLLGRPGTRRPGR